MTSTEALREFFGNYWELILLIATWAGIVGLAVKRRHDWRRKRFSQQVNFSLNYVEEGLLKLRTLVEVPAREVWLNDYGVKQVQKAAQTTTTEQPFLRLRSGPDMDYVKRAVVNVLSERFSPVFIGRALGGDTVTGTFVFGITWERYGNIRTQKLRVIVIRRDELEALFGMDNLAESVQVARPTHADRLTTLRQLYQLDRSRRAKHRRMVGEVELGVCGLPDAAGGQSAPAPSHETAPEPSSPPERAIDPGIPQPPPLPPEAKRAEPTDD